MTWKIVRVELLVSGSTSGSIAAFADTVVFELECAGGVKRLFEGEGLPSRSLSLRRPG